MIKIKSFPFCAIAIILTTITHKGICQVQSNLAVSTYNGESIFTATNRVELDPGFAAPGGSTFHIYISTPSCTSSSPVLSSNRNYIMTRIPQISGMKDVGSVNTSSASRLLMQTTVEYFDGLGRPLQSIQIQASPLGYDIVQPFTYDQYGRQPIKYLPYVSSTCSSGIYHDQALNNATNYAGSEQYQFYQLGNQNIPVNINPYSQTVIEPSPLNRAVEQGSPGAPWQPYDPVIGRSGHTNKIEYGFNNGVTDTADATFRGVKYYKAVNGNNDHTRSLTDDGWYTENQLDLTVVKNENWVSGRSGTIEEYKDNLGRVVLKRLWQTETSPLSTYYVYDDMGNLSFVLTPATVPDLGGITQNILDNLCYQYRYDARKRLIEKRIPGRGDWDAIVYNDLDQIVLSQDPVQKLAGKWMFKKYDGIGRDIASGALNSSDSRSTWQFNINGQGVLWESRDESNSNGTGYTSAALPLHSVIDKYYILNYFDKYSNIDDILADYVSLLTSTARGLPTGTRVNVLGTTQCVNKVVGYNANWLPSLTGERNLYFGSNAYYVTNNTFDFLGRLIQKDKEHQNVIFSDDLSEYYGYDTQGRLLSITDQFGTALSNSSGSAMVVKNNYNELGQRMNKQLHSEDGGATFIQDMDYIYNERGFLTKINNPQIITSDRLFGMELIYNNSLNGSIAQYNGNVSGVKWQTGVRNGLGLVQEPMTYGFTYDVLNKLTASSYGSGVSNSQTHYFDENLTYDRNGNIRSLSRFSNISGAATPIDQLYYTYDNTFQSNRLASVTDNSGRNEGLISGTTAYTYDANGSIKSDPSKGITNIDYNDLGLPQTIYRTTGNINYVYDATGAKLNVTSGSVVKKYWDGWEFNGTQVIEVATAEGLARFNAGAYKFEYFLKDNMGNTRVTIGKSSSGIAEVLQVNHYYPFGMSYNSSGYQFTLSGSENQYKYSGKEYQEETGLYDYGARYYDPVIGRWGVIDPLNEKSRKWSTYNYAYSNPMRYIDPDGMQNFLVQDPLGNGKTLSIDGSDVTNVYTAPNDAAKDEEQVDNTNAPDNDGGADEKPKPATTESKPKTKEERRAETGNTKEEDEREDKMFDGFMIHLGGLVSMTSGTLDLASSDGVTFFTGTVSTGKIVGGFSAAAFGLVKMVHGYRGDKEETPGGLGEAVDRGFGGSGTVGQIVDLGLAGRPKKYYDFILLGYGVATSQAFKNVLGKTSKSTQTNIPVAHPQVKIVPYFYQY